MMAVILPCAGYGRRLGLSTPKELYEVVQGTRLIDFSLAHIVAARETVVRVVVVVRPGKEEVFDYVRGRLSSSGIEVMQAYFRPEYYEWAGSVMSAQDCFLDENSVLLPDSVVEFDTKDTHGEGLLSTMGKMLGESRFCLAVCRAEGPMLASLGAVRIEGGRVVDLQDKPSDVRGYNGFWVSYGFRREAAGDVYRFLANSIRHEVHQLPCGLFPAPFVEVGGYADLGTWEGMKEFRETN